MSLYLLFTILPPGLPPVAVLGVAFVVCCVGAVVAWRGLRRKGGGD
jgi:hypothetical protein